MKKFLKIFGITFSVLIGLFICFILLFPTFVSSSFGKSLLLNTINKKIPGHISIESLNLSWLGKQEVRKITITAPDRSVIFSADSLDGDFPLFTFLFHNSLRTLVLKNANATISTDNEGNTNLEYALTKGDWKGNDLLEPAYLKNINIDLKNSGTNFSLQGTGSTQQNNLNGTFNIDALYGDKRSVQFQALNFPTLLLDQLLAIKFPAFKGTLRKILGDHFEEIKIVTEKNDLFIDAISATTKAHIQGVFDSEDILFSKESQIHFNIPPGNFKQTGLALPSNQSLLAEIKFDNLKVPLDKQRVNATAGELAITIAPITFNDGLKLDPLSVNVQFPSANKNIFINLSLAGFYHYPFSNQLSFQLEKRFLVSSKCFEENANLEGHLLFNSTPFLITGVKEGLKIKSQITPEKEQENLPKITLEINHICKNLEGRLLIKDLPNDTVNIREINIPFRVANDKLNLKGSAYSKEGKTILNGDGFLTCRNDEFSLDSMEGDLNLHLFDLHLVSLDYLLKGDAFANLNQDGQINANWQLYNSRNYLKNIEGTLIAHSSSRDVAFNIKADNNFLKGSLTHQWNLTPIAIALEANLHKFPVQALCPVLDASLCQKVQSVFGSSLNGSSHLQMSDDNGSLALAVQGDNGSFALNGLIQNNVLLLNEPLKAKVRVTPEFESAILKDFLPFLSPIISAKGPIEVVISPHQFRFPLKPFSLHQVTVAQGTLSFPLIRTSQKSALAKTVSLLGVNNDVQVQFTPLYFSLHKNILTLMRMDMLIAQKYPVASWGAIDFNDDQLRLVVGLSSAAINKAFHVEGLHKNYMLQIPIKGNLSKPQVDTTKATARIAALVAQKSNTTSGSVLGTVLDVASGSLNEEKVPSPTTQPLPWESSTSQKNAKDEKAKSFNPIRGLEKEARSLIKGLLGK
ncbi:MAG: hypothetical protein ACSNEK_01775 [Parachlamydiaceae bacterium]